MERLRTSLAGGGGRVDKGPDGGAAGGAEAWVVAPEGLGALDGVATRLGSEGCAGGASDTGAEASATSAVRETGGVAFEAFGTAATG